jgi:hypothetical protein
MAPSGLTGASYFYDSAGNLTSDGIWAYDAREKMALDTVSTVITNYGIKAMASTLSITA